MKKLSFFLAAALLVLGLSQCKKDKKQNEVSGDKQHIVLSAGNGNDGSKVNPTVTGAVLGLTWEKADVITVSGGATGTLTLKSGEGETHATFEGDITKVNDEDLVFTCGSVDYGNEAGTLEWVKENICLEGKSAYSPSGEYDVDMLLTYALLKLDLSSLGTAGGNTVTIKVGSATKAIVLNVANAAAGLYVALPTDNAYDAESPAEVTYTFEGNSKSIGKVWAIKQNMYYTAKDTGGDPILVQPAAPTSVTTVTGCSGLIPTMGGTVTLTEAQKVEYGFVYSETVSVPEVGVTGCTKFPGNTENLPVGTKSFTIDLTGLTVGTIYYVRAYAIGESGAAVYAPNSSDGIKTLLAGDAPQALPSTWTNGKNPHPFTVASGRTVYFSQGNLQYIGSASPAYWKFADHQFDFLGTTGQNSTFQTVDRDLFGWGTSGVSHSPSATYIQPYHTNSPYSKYYAYGSYTNNLYDGGTNAGKADWGYNAISNGGNTVNDGWRTLTSAEWNYLVSNTSKWAYGTVGGCIKGIILLPDDWTLPSGCSFTGGVMKFTTNVYNYSQWHDMESAGAVFLPAAGIRITTNVNKVNLYGFYWASSYYNRDFAYNLFILSDDIKPLNGSDRSYGFSVRLVHE